MIKVVVNELYTKLYTTPENATNFFSVSTLRNRLIYVTLFDLMMALLTILS